MEHTPIGKLILKLAPPVMLALLIQSAYNIVDSYFVAKYSPEGLTALSVVFPIQLLITALATGTGTGINIIISHMDGNKTSGEQKHIAACGLWTGILNYLIFTTVSMSLLKMYLGLSSADPLVQNHGLTYMRIILLGSFGIFLESNCTKMLQAKGNMVIPMIAQVTGAIVNIVLDPLLIFGYFVFPAMGMRGAALASIAGQWIAMGITLWSVCRTFDVRGTFKRTICYNIYKNGFPSMVMQALYTVYIVGLNLILKQFSDNAVTVLGIYYKLQTLFFIPLLGLQQVIVPIISYNHGAGNKDRIRAALRYAISISVCVMALSTFLFWIAPEKLIGIFSNGNTELLSIGVQAFRFISLSFIPAGFVMMFTVYFQGIAQGKKSLTITIVRQIILLVPLAWILHFWGLKYVWLTFPITEFLAVLLCFFLIKRQDL